MTQPRQVEVTLSPSEAPRFAGVLQQGVVLTARTGCSLWSFLVDELGIAPEYVKERITTIFLDGDVVDSLEGATVREGSVVALSAAMPGLVGATLRRGGYYRAMRSAITHSPDASPATPRKGEAGTVRVKLFNLLIPELGPALLEHGVVLEHRQATELLPAGCSALGDSPPAERLALRVRFSDEGQASRRA